MNKLKYVVVIVFLIELIILGYCSSIILKDYLNPSDKEQVILNEMLVKVINSKDYEKIKEKEEIIAIQTNVEKFKGGAFPYNLTIVVKTNEQSHSFYCKNKICSNVEVGSWFYSEYKEDTKPVLPLH